MKQNGRLANLLAAVSHARPRTNWPPLAELEADIWPISETVQPTAPQVIVLAEGEGAIAVGSRGVNVVGDVYGTIITGDTYNYYIEGTRFSLPDFTTAVKNFLYNYLGDEANPVPFGGRDNALAQLEQWRTQVDAPPRLLLTAPAGRGKSALLVRWSEYLQAQPNVVVVFMPISIRFNTNQETDTFSLLATRLAHLYGKEIPPKWSNFPAVAWRRLVAEYLQEPLPNGKHLLLIMDGLDEAAWEVGAYLFPHQLPERVRLVISARYRGGEEPGPAPWLRRLDWDNKQQMATTMELEPLTQMGVRDVLEKMGCPLDELSQNVDIVTELYRLSEGDPLLVKLYVEDLWQQGEEVTRLQPEDLREIKPSYEGYFEKWWTDQEKLWGQDDPLAKELVSDVFDLLSMALGSLTTSDLRQLLPGKVHSRDLKRAIQQLHRFVIGDGQKQGYVFAHPKLGEFFRDKLEPDEQAEWLENFIAWGQGTIIALEVKQIEPCHVPRYLMQHFIRHLTESDNGTLVWQTLTSFQWIIAQTHHDPALRQLSQDIELAITRCEKEGIESLPKTIAYSLLRGNIGSRVSKIPPEAIGIMASVGHYEQALKYAGLGDSAWHQAEAYINISDHLINQGDTKSIELLLLAQEIAEGGSRVKLLCKISEMLQKAGERDRANEVLEKALKLLENDNTDGEALIRAAITAANLDNSEAISQIVELAKQYIGPGFISRNRLKSRIALVLGKAKKADALMQLQKGMHSWGIGAEAFAWIAYGLYLA
ncbi:MAG: hypothetical protein KDE56_24820, partial [Anaerolineales bacterium]|nr:hypothetical protein [Anaerolineales bacterium]